MKRSIHPKRTVGDIGEFGLIGQIQRQLAGHARGVASTAPRRSGVVGIGDDCAVLRSADRVKYLLYTCDPVVEGVHYLPNTPPHRVGWKAMARNLSDIAAMGGQPRWAVVSIGLRRRTSVAYVQQLYAGLQAAAKQFGCTIVGGDSTHVRHEQFVVVAMLGEVEKRRLTLRSDAKVGDIVFVTGALGGSLRGKHLTFTPRVAEARWLVRHFRIHAMIDLSDGLSSDLRRCIEASRMRIGFEIDANRIPIAPAARGSLAAALNDGEDFELLFTIDPRYRAELQRQWNRRFTTGLTEIGRVVRARGAITLINHGTKCRSTRQRLKPRGYDHFDP
jgi:thiamine-monophosphate kinase